MGLVFCDGFDSYSTSTDLGRNWTGVAAPSGTYFDATSGRTGGGAFKTTATSKTIKTALDLFSIGQDAVMCAGFHLKMSAAPSADSFALQISNAAGTYLGGLGINTSGFPFLSSNGFTSLVAGVTNICDNAWHWIEFNYSPSNSSAMACYVDGVVQWSANYATGFLTGGLTCIAIVSPATQTFTLDDVIVYNSIVAQDPQNSSFPLGPKLISTLRPTSDVSVDFTRSTGADNFALVDDQSADDDSTYVEDGTSTDADEYGYGNLGFTPTSVTSVQLVSRVKNAGGGSIQYKNRCVSGGTTSDSSAITATGSYVNSRTILNRDPNTSAAWTGTNLDAAKFGVTVV